MKYLVLSDSHGNVDNMVRAVELVKPQGIIHLGDGWRDVEELRELFPSLPLEQVPGNCDFGRFEALERVLILDDHRVLIAHGHTLGVKTGLLRAQYRALEMNADILLFGHTHVPLVDAASRPMMMNPGSIGDPRRPTYGVLEFRDGQIYPSVFRLDAYQKKRCTLRYISFPFLTRSKRAPARAANYTKRPRPRRFWRRGGIS